MAKHSSDTSVRVNKRRSRAGRPSNLPTYINTALILGGYLIIFKTEVKTFLAWLSNVL